MCGIGGAVSLGGSPIRDLKPRIDRVTDLLEHRGPDGRGAWLNDASNVGLAHTRLAIIDTSENARQPMVGPNGCAIAYNGEVYNYRELRAGLERDWTFKSASDTEVILAGFSKKGPDYLSFLKGMFAFAIWDEREKSLFCARDRFGVKPFYYTVADEIFYFASEAKALLPFVPKIETNEDALQDYFSLQYSLGDETLFKGIFQLPPAHFLTISDGVIQVTKYWDVNYSVDFDHSEKWFFEQLEEKIGIAVGENLVSDVEVGAYVSGGIDSSLIFGLAREKSSQVSKAFHGRFLDHPGYDESNFANMVVDDMGGELFTVDISAEDLLSNFEQVIYHLDFPVAGPGSFPQFMVSKLAAEKVKTVLGGQGGDEIFGGYARYVIAYLEQCLSAAIDGTYNNGNYVVTLESIIPNLGLLREYKPMIKSFWSRNLFGPLEERYFDLLDRSAEFGPALAHGAGNRDSVFGRFQGKFASDGNVSESAYLDRMMRFDFKNFLPALLHVEDRMSMAHGLESRVPFLDHEVVSLVASIPADVKFGGGETKRLLKEVFSSYLPEPVARRRDKMGFPVPLTEWGNKELIPFLNDTLGGAKARSRDYLGPKALATMLEGQGKFSRKTWALLSLETWQQQFHDQSARWKFVP